MKGKNNRKLIVTILGLLTISLLVCGTLAFFNESFYVTNVITTGKVDITVLESFGDENVSYSDDKSVVTYEDKAMPGMTFTKEIKVQNNGSDAYVRVKIEKKINLDSNYSDGKTAKADLDLIQLNFNDDEKWVDGKDGYYYYKDALKKGETTTCLLKSVTIAPEMTNVYQNSGIDIDVSAEATQAKNNGDDALSAKGWPGNSGK